MAKIFPTDHQVAKFLPKKRTAWGCWPMTQHQKVGKNFTAINEVYFSSIWLNPEYCQVWQLFFNKTRNLRNDILFPK
jgi:hypothetical protein